MAEKKTIEITELEVPYTKKATGMLGYFQSDFTGYFNTCKKIIPKTIKLLEVSDSKIVYDVTFISELDKKVKSASGDNKKMLSHLRTAFSHLAGLDRTSGSVKNYSPIE